MKVFVLMLLVACATDDEITADNATDRVTCEQGAYVHNNAPVTDCARACESLPDDVEIANPPCPVGPIVFVEDMRGVCSIEENPLRVDWVSCE